MILSDDDDDLPHMVLYLTSSLISYKFKEEQDVLNDATSSYLSTL